MSWPRAVFLCGLLLRAVLGYEILALFPHVGKSHMDAFRPLLEELVERGHSLTVVSFFPRESPKKNYRDVSLEGLAKTMVNSLSVEAVAALDPVSDFGAISEIGLDTCRAVLPSSQVRDLLASNRSYDLVLTELFTTDCFLGVVDRLGAPFVALSSSSLFPTTEWRFGFLDNPSYVPNMFLPLTASMTFSERLKNAMTTLQLYLYRRYYFDKEAEILVKRYLGEDVRSLEDVKRETILVLANRHYSIGGPRPFPPAVVEVGGIHITPPKPIPVEIANFIEKWEKGVIYFSMGSVLRAESFPKDKLKIFLQVFSQLDQGVLWKYDMEIADKPDNVFTSPWLPQRDILAHERIKVFITHGGLLGSMEGVHCGVPMIGLPMYGDQGSNMAALQSAGVAITLSFQTIDNGTLLSAITKIIEDPGYKKRAKELSGVFLDRSMTPVETGVWWVEWAAKRGRSGPRLTLQPQPAYQALLLDVFALLLFGFLALFYTVFILANSITTFLVRLITRRGVAQKIKEE